MLLHWSPDLERCSGTDVVVPPYLAHSFRHLWRRASEESNIVGYRHDKVKDKGCLSQTMSGARRNPVPNPRDEEMSLPSHTVTSSLEVTGVTSVSPTGDNVAGDTSGHIGDSGPQAAPAPAATVQHDPALVEQWACSINNRVSTCEMRLDTLDNHVANVRADLSAIRQETQPEAVARKLDTFISGRVQERVLPLESRMAQAEAAMHEPHADPQAMSISQALVASQSKTGRAPSAAGHVRAGGSRAQSMAGRAGPAPREEEDSGDDVPMEPPSRTPRREETMSRRSRKSVKSPRKTKSSRAEPKKARKDRRRRKERDDPSSDDPSSTSSSSSSSSSSEQSSSSSDSDGDGHRRRRDRPRHRTRTPRSMRQTVSVQQDEALRIKGPEHRGVQVLTSTNQRYVDLVDYRCYRLLRVKQTRTPNETGKVNSLTSKMEKALGERKFDGKDPVLIFSALSNIVEEADNMKMTEAQLFLAVPRLLSGAARDHFVDTRDGSRRGGESLRSWPETVNFLLSAYARPRVISGALDDLRELRQRRDEEESEFSDRLCRALGRCGGVHTAEEKKTFFVEKLHPTIQSLVCLLYTSDAADD